MGSPASPPRARLEYSPHGVSVIVRGTVPECFGLRFEACAIELAARLNASADPVLELQAWRRWVHEHTLEVISGALV